MSEGRRFCCNACDREVDPQASVCPGCQHELVYCSACRDVAVAEPEHVLPARGAAERAAARLTRERYTCGRCGRAGVRCRSYTVNGSCNGLARADRAVPAQFCSRCANRVWDVSRSVAIWGLITYLGSRIRR
jgi:hypothetical protein